MRPVGTRYGTAGGSARQTKCSPPFADIAIATIDSFAQSAQKFTAHGTLRAGHNKDQKGVHAPEMGHGCAERTSSSVDGSARMMWTMSPLAPVQHDHAVMAAGEVPSQLR